MNDAIHDAVTPTVVRIFPTAPNRGDVTMRELVDAYMASYTGRDKALPQRVGFWVEAIGHVRLRDLDADQIADHLEQLAAQPVRRYVGKDEHGKRPYRAHHARAGSTVNRYRTALSAVLTWARHRRKWPVVRLIH